MKWYDFISGNKNDKNIKVHLTENVKNEIAFNTFRKKQYAGLSLYIVQYMNLIRHFILWKSFITEYRFSIFNVNWNYGYKKFI